jgi:membrane fusion protein (multidrug efflux system)
MRVRTRLVALFLTFPALAVIHGCKGQADTPAPQGQPPLSVKTQQVEARQLPLTIDTVGRTEGSKEVQLRARVSGILEKQSYEEGARVTAGSTLFQLDRVPFEIALGHARAGLAQAKATQTQAQRTHERLQSLVQDKLVSRQQADDAASALESAQAAVLAAEAQVREAEVNLSYTTVTAPISGIAGRAEHSVGSLITANSESGLLTTLTQADPIWIRFALSVAEHEALRTAGARNPESLRVELVRADGSIHPAKGRVNFAGSTVDAKLGTVQLRAEFQNPDMSVLPGEYLRVRVSGGELKGVTVPQTAVLQGPQGAFVWIVNAQGQAEQRPVQTGEWTQDAWRIREGLAPGETVIVDNLLKLRPGAQVTPFVPEQRQAHDQSTGAQSHVAGNG